MADHFRGLEAFDRALEQQGERADRALHDVMGAPVLVELRRSVRPKNERSGALGNSIVVNTRRVGFGIYELEAGPTETYTRISEIGKRGTRHRAGTHWFLPGFARVEPTLVDLVAKALGDAIHRR